MKTPHQVTLMRYVGCGSTRLRLTVAYCHPACAGSETPVVHIWIQMHVEHIWIQIWIQIWVRTLTYISLRMHALTALHPSRPQHVSAHLQFRCANSTTHHQCTLCRTTTRPLRGGATDAVADLI